MSTIRQLISVNAIIAVTLAIGFVNNIAIAGIFGLSRDVDIYFASFMMVRLFMVLVVDYLGKNFLPIFAARKKESASSASRLTSLVVTQVGIVAIVTTLSLVLLSERLFAVILPGFANEDINAVVGMFAIMAPGIVFMTVDAFHGYVWQHDEKFSRVVSAKLCTPLTRTIFILGLSPWLGIQALPIGFLCGQIVTSVAMGIGVPYQFRPHLSWSDPDMRKIFRSSSVLVGTGMIARSRSIIIQYFGSMFEEGAIAAIAIAQKICKPVYQSAQMGLRMIVFTRSARAVARGNMIRIAKLHKLGITGTLFLVSPVAAWYLFEADVIVNAVFQRGAFTDAMGNLVVAALLGYAVSIVFMGMNQMISNGFYALERIRVPAIAMPLSTLVFLTFATILGPEYGIFGLTLSSSITAALLGIVLLTLFKQAIPIFDLAAVLIGFVRYSISAVIAAIIARQIRLWFDLEAIPGFMLSGMMLATIYLGLMFLTRDPILKIVFEQLSASRRDDSNSAPD